MYETYHVHRRSDLGWIANVTAQSETEAVFRIVGGEVGRADYYVVSQESRAYHQEASRRGRFIAAPFERD